MTELHRARLNLEIAARAYTSAAGLPVPLRVDRKVSRLRVAALSYGYAWLTAKRGAR